MTLSKEQILKKIEEAKAAAAAKLQEIQDVFDQTMVELAEQCDPKEFAVPEPIATRIVRDTQGRITGEFCLIPGGTFLMGSNDPDAYDDEKPQKLVECDEFWMCKYPITNEQWVWFLENSNYKPRNESPYYLNHWVDGKPPAGKENHPVVYVSAEDAQAYCDFYGFQLPTEIEWEKAARGTDGRKYPWGNEEPTEEHCNFNNNVGDTTPVESYPKGTSPYGVRGMSGNVYEITRSPWDPDLMKKIGALPANN